jgi:orotidine-5'-phosphate decarboxylase
MTAVKKLEIKNNEGKFICVGLDSDLKKIPEVLRSSDNPIYEFNRHIIDATSQYAAAYKINFAFYESMGLEGFKTLVRTISYIPEDILIIADAKRGDIGNTSEKYAESIFNYFKCDSVTVNPYMGSDSVEPFLTYSDKLIFILALTSNPGAADFEKLKTTNGTFVYEEVIQKVKEWNNRGNCGIVFGATNSDELKSSISSFGDLSVLLPGVGAQGGSLSSVVKSFNEAGRKNYLINVSRGIIYKDQGKSFAEAAKKEIINLNNEINDLL